MSGEGFIVTNFNTETLLDKQAYTTLLKDYVKCVIVPLEPELTRVFTNKNGLFNAQDAQEVFKLIVENYMDESEILREIYDEHHDSVREKAFDLLGNPERVDAELYFAANLIGRTIVDTLYRNIVKVHETLLRLEIPSLDMVKCMYVFDKNTETAVVFTLRTHASIKNNKGP
jgi:hypothetical protein